MNRTQNSPKRRQLRKTAFCSSETLKSYAGDWPTVTGCPVSNPGNNCANGLFGCTVFWLFIQHEHLSIVPLEPHWCLEMTPQASKMRLPVFFCDQELTGLISVDPLSGVVIPHAVSGGKLALRPELTASGILRSLQLKQQWSQPNCSISHTMQWSIAKKRRHDQTSLYSTHLSICRLYQSTKKHNPKWQWHAYRSNCMSRSKIHRKWNSCQYNYTAYYKDRKESICVDKAQRFLQWL